jgi:hypothetical protein
MFILNSASSIARIISLTHIGILLWFLRQDLSCNPGYSKTRISVSYLKIVILLLQILSVVMTGPCSISALVKVTTLFCNSHSVLHSFWCLWTELLFEPELILARQVLYYLSKTPCPPCGHKVIFQLSPICGTLIWFHGIPGNLPMKTYNP